MLKELEARGCWLQDHEGGVKRKQTKKRKGVKRFASERRMDFQDGPVNAETFDCGDLDRSSAESSQNSQKAKRRFRLKKAAM